MENYLLAERETKLAELSEREASLARLEEELAALEDRSKQAKAIEGMLAASAVEALKAHPVDKTQIPEIKKTIKAKTAAVSVTISLFASKRRFDNDYKLAQKSCVNELKRIFGELEIDVKRFQKNGISREHLDALIGIMERICVEGAKIGTIPLSYQQKVYKWQQVAKELPEDIERKRQAVEKTAKKKIDTKKDKVEDEIADIKSKITAAKRSKTNAEKKLEEAKREVAQLEADAPRRKEDITSRAEKKKQDVSHSYESDIQELERKCAEQKREIEAAIEAVKENIESNQSSIDALLREKETCEAELEKAFVLSFSKKRAIRERIAEIDNTVLGIKKAVRDHQSQLGELQIKNPEADLEIARVESKQSFDRAIWRLDSEVATQYEAIEQELDDARRVEKNKEVEIASLCKQLEKLKATQDSKAKELDEISASLEEFHADFIIKTYGKEVGIRSVLSEKKSMVKAEAAAVKALKKEIAALDKEIAKIEKEQLRQSEAHRKAEVARAKEEDRIRKEHQERQRRIQQEMLDREKEQKAVLEKANSLDHVGKLVAEFESDRNHALLQDEICPLTDDGKRVIYNSIVRKAYRQMAETPGCKQYSLVFVDQNGKTISEQRLIEQKEIGKKTMTSFELKSDRGFDDSNYYLLIMNFDTGEIISAQRYKISISFSNDFDF